MPERRSRECTNPPRALACRLAGARPPWSPCVRAMTFLLAVFLLAIGPWASASPVAAPGLMTVHIINVGQGDAILLALPGGQRVLVDGGPTAAGPTVVAHLDSLGVTHLDLIIATHGHADHIGGLSHVIRSRPVAAVWADSWDCSTLTCRTFYQSISEQGIVTDTARAGHVFDWGAAQGLVVHPADPLAAHPNDRSVVLLVTYGSVDVLLTGDAEAAAEVQMLSSGLPLAAEILKVAHHGSESSTTPAFLAAVAPRDALISVWASNPYGHPRQAILDRLTASGVEVWRTDLEGSIVVSTDGNSYSMSAESGRRAPPLTWRTYLPIVRAPSRPPAASVSVSEP